MDLSRVLNAGLSRLPQEQHHWSSFFRIVDEDGSGRISFEELEKYVRGNPHVLPGAMGITQRRLPDTRLFALWLALDVDGSGYIDAGEFGRFMRKGASGNGSGAAGPGGASTSAIWRPIAALSSHSRVSAQEIMTREVIAQELSAQRSDEAKQELMREARRLEEALANLQPEFIDEVIKQDIAPETPRLPPIRSPRTTMTSTTKSSSKRTKGTRGSKSARLPERAMRLYGFTGGVQTARGSPVVINRMRTLANE